MINYCQSTDNLSNNEWLYVFFVESYTNYKRPVVVLQGGYVPHYFSLFVAPPASYLMDRFERGIDHLIQPQFSVTNHFSANWSHSFVCSYLYVSCCIKLLQTALPPPLHTALGQWSLCVADIEQSLWTAIVLTAELSLGDRASRHRYGFLHLMSRPLAHKCFSFNELWPRRQGVLSIIWLLMPLKY